MRCSLSFGLGLIVMIASVGYADAQMIRVHSDHPIRSESDARRICPELCARTTDFGHRYYWEKQGPSWEHDECHCSIKH